ncbi:hypothetical protein G8E10_24805 [Rhizobiaceae bacterium CRRU44]|uniref:Uncharacterized protein n=1 Tax=Ferranicluibacter rubi TaxID=2715133 RepID=A0AA43ZL45_9HYPH|nr:hypothetical protein [Ferranicluibacter rubi]NHT78923.1 hypothetical protein [Ferranicluibacter rubi]
MTTSLVITEEQHTLLKRVAATRMMRGKSATASVSDVIRKLIEDSTAALEAEIRG